MKKYLSAVLAVICLLNFAQVIFTQENSLRENDLAKMHFEFELNKSEYLPLEPIIVNFKLSNRTNKPLKILSPSFSNDAKLSVTFDGQNKLESIANSNIRLVRLNNIFQPGQIFEEKIIIETGLEYFFSKIGDYQVRFILSGGDEGKINLESDLADIKIIEPTGVNKDALEFFRKNKYRNRQPESLFTWDDKKDEIGQTILETFVETYSNSIYGEYAIYQLGFTYLYKGDFNKAKAEFEKIENSENKLLAVTAKKSLLMIEEKIKEKQKAYLQKIQKDKTKQPE